MARFTPFSSIAFGNIRGLSPVYSSFIGTYLTVAMRGKSTNKWGPFCHFPWKIKEQKI